MKAIGLTKYLPINNPESLVDLQVATPEPGDRDLLVRVEAISVNPVDTKIRTPKSDVEKEPQILGWDAAGIVEATGPAAKLFRLGDAVYCAGSISRPGTNSEFHLVDERIAGRKPANLSFAESGRFALDLDYGMGSDL
jgi:NADPH2:quinone reductase